jgi:hypothetical protein
MKKLLVVTILVAVCLGEDDGRLGAVVQQRV